MQPLPITEGARQKQIDLATALAADLNVPLPCWYNTLNTSMGNYPHGLAGANTVALHVGYPYLMWEGRIYKTYQKGAVATRLTSKDLMG